MSEASLAECPSMCQAVIVTHGSQYKGKTTSLPGWRWNQSPQPHLFLPCLSLWNGPACQEALSPLVLGLPAPWRTQVGSINFVLCWRLGGMCEQVPAHSVEEGRRGGGDNDKQESDPLQCDVKTTIKERNTGRGPSPAWGGGQCRFLGVLPGLNPEGPTGLLSG